MSFFFISVIQSQPFPITVSIGVSPPYPSRVNEYINQPNKIMATLINTTATVQSVYVQGQFTDWSGIRIYTDPTFKMSRPVVLQPKIPYRLNLDNIGQVFDANYLVFEGISKNELLYGTGLPEGEYTICLRVYDYQTNEPLSAEGPQGCSNTFTISNVEPPEILQPVCGDTIAAVAPQFINFLWSRPPGAPPDATFSMKLFEVFPGTRNINDAVQSGILPLFFETVVNVNSCLLNPSGPTLVEGQTYALLVTIQDPKNNINFRNHGMSEVCSFTWGSSGNTMKITGGPYSILGPQATCVGESAQFTVTNASPDPNIHSQWCLSTTAPCSNPASMPTTTVEILPGGLFSVDNGTIHSPLNFTQLSQYGWMRLIGSNGGPFSGSLYNTPTSLPAGKYCIGWAEQDPSWVFADFPVQLMVYAPTVAGSLNYTQSAGCAPPDVTVNLTVSGYTATQWDWYYFDNPNWLPVPGTVPAINTPNTGDPGTYSELISKGRQYKVVLKNGTCPDEYVTTNIHVMTIPEGSICVEPNIQPSPGPGIPGLDACVNPYPICPTNWLPICSGCDAILTLKDISMASYNTWNTKITWYFQQARYPCPPLPPNLFNPGESPPSMFPGTWTPLTIPANQINNLTYNTNPLTTTTWYCARVEAQNDPTCYREFYAVVLVFDPPAKPLVNPPGPIITCQFPVTLTLTNTQDYPTTDCSNREYSWDGGQTWTPLPDFSVNPFLDFTVNHYGAFVLAIRNQCGVALSDTIFVVPEVIPVVISGPCCVCEGQCGTFSALPDIPGNTYVWSCDPPVSMSPGPNSSSINICPTTPTDITLVVTNPDGCVKTLTTTVIICPNL